MSKKLVLYFVLIMLVTFGISPAAGERAYTWQLTHTISNIAYACGVDAHPSDEFINVSGRGGLLVQLSTSDYSVLKTLQLPVATEGDSLAFGTPYPDHSLVLYPDEHGSVFIVDPVNLTLQITLPQSWYYGTYRMVVTQDGSTAIGGHPHYSYPGWLYFYNLTTDPIQTELHYVNGQPGGLALSPDDQYIFYANCCGGVPPQIHKLDLHTRAEVGVLDLSGVVSDFYSSLSTDPVNRKIFAGTPEGLVVVDMDTLAYTLYPLGTVSRVTFDSALDLMVATGTNELLILNPDTYEVIQRITLGSIALCIPEISVDGNKVYVGDVFNSVMYVIEKVPANRPPADKPGGPHSGSGQALLQP